MVDRGFTDDPTIPDNAILWRWIPPWHFTYDRRERRWRPSSAAFEDDPDGDPMSVVIAAESHGPEAALTGPHQDYGLAAISARLVHERGQIIVRAPTAEEPAHAYVVGDKRESTRKAFARQAVWVVRPPLHLTDDPPQR